MRDTFEFPDPHPMPQDALPPMIIDSFPGGNSVNPDLAAALARANCAHLAEQEVAA